MAPSVLTKSQTKTFTRVYTENGTRYTITATVRYDDKCNNGHNSFSITGEIKGPRGLDVCGCIHEDIAKRFPELEPFIKWHLCSSDGPLHYIANTVYNAGDLDHWGLRKGETGPGKYHLIGEGKERELDHARSSAIWPEATDEQLLVSKEELDAALKARLPGLLAEFREAVESFGFTY
jgi:hypothetical protein